MNWKTLALAILAGITVFGCSPEAKEDMSQAGDSASKAVEKTGDAVATEAEGVKQASADSMMTGKVRSAITTASDLKIEDLDVDTTNGVITLHGVAESSDAKENAGKIAELQGGDDYKIDNQISVKG